MVATSSSAKSSAAAAEAVGSKAARACDGCLRRRARWYCAADDAFLCQGCDASVHSANPLARRHERLRLQPSSPLPDAGRADSKRERKADVIVPAWFRRKPRTPRGGHAANKSVRRELSRRRIVVPEAPGGSNSPEAEEEQVLCRVPVFHPALAEFCSPPIEDAGAAASSCGNEDGAVANPTKPDAPPQQQPTQFFPDGGHVNFEPTDAELREFAADMEALLGRGLDDGNEEDSFYMETLGLLDDPVVDDGARVKVETENVTAFEFEARDVPTCRLEVGPEACDDMLDIDSPQADDEKAVSSGGTGADANKFLQRSLSLTLNYEAIIQSWRSSPWTGGGDKPHVKPDDCWPHDYTCMWMVGGGVGHGGEELMSLPRLGMEGGREARVSRYVP